MIWSLQSTMFLWSSIAGSSSWIAWCKKGAISKFSSLETILNYTLHTCSFEVVMSILNQELAEVIVVILLSYFLIVWIHMCFQYYNFMALRSSSTQYFGLISSMAVQYTGSNYIYIFIYWMFMTQEFPETVTWKVSYKCRSWRPGFFIVLLNVRCKEEI